MTPDRWEPVPVPLGDGRHDIGDDVRAAIVRRLMDEWSRDPDLTPERVRQLAMWAGASVRALMHELGMLRDFAGLPSAGEGAANHTLCRVTSRTHACWCDACQQARADNNSHLKRTNQHG